MAQRALHFVAMPERSHKPRKRGLTLARDLGMGYEIAASWMGIVDQFIDYVKMRHIFVLMMTEDKNDVTRRKIELYKRHQIDVHPGGIVFELAHLSNAVQRTFDTLVKLGFTAVECSENVIPLTLEQKLRYIAMAKTAGLKVLFEVGEKYPTEKLAVDVVASEMQMMLQAGCELLILEKSLLDMCLGKRGGKPEAELMVALAERVGLANIVFEAETTAHQSWLLKQFGPDVNIGPNVNIDVVHDLEAMRRTLNREGGFGYLIEHMQRSVSEAPKIA